MLRVAGIDQRGAFEAGEGAYAVADLHIRFLASARLDDDLVVITRLTQVRAASVVIHQRVSRRGETLAIADVTAALVAPSGRARRQPAAWVDIFRRLLDQKETE